MLKFSTKKTKFWPLSKLLLWLSGILIVWGSTFLNVNANNDSNNRGNELTFTGINAQYLDQYFSTVHFSVARNDFGGGIFRLPSETLNSPQAIRANGQTIKCSSKVRGFYYNSQRGERLRPLDEKSQTDLASINTQYGKTNLKTNWGFYTNCTGLSQNGEEHAIYGKITHNYHGKIFELHAGLQNIIDTNTLKGNLKCNLQRVANAYPLGYLYDTQGGIWLVGLSVKPEKIQNSYNEVTQFHTKFISKLDSQCVDKVFDYNGENIIDGEKKIENRQEIVTAWIGSDAKTTMMNLGIRGIIWLSTEVKAAEQAKILGNPQKTSLLVSTENSIATTINIAAKKAEILCRNKWGSQINPNASIICLKGTKPIDPNQYGWKTIIVKNWNLQLTEYMNSDAKPITIFINKWKLILNWENQGNKMITFSPNGYLSADNNTSIKANYLKGNFIINGVITAQWEKWEVKNKLVIHGKLASFNTIDSPHERLKDRIKNIVTLNDEDKIWLREIFTRYCKPNWKGSDGTNCKGAKGNGNSNTSLFLTDKAFWIIDMSFSSPLFQ